MGFPMNRNNVQVRIVSRFTAVCALLSAAGCVTAFTLGAIDAVLMVGMLALTAVLLFVLWFKVRSQTDGNIEVSDQGLTLHTRGGTELYPWTLVSGVRITSLQEGARLDRLFHSVLRIDLSEPIVEVRLSRRLRAGLFGGRGTTIVELPTASKKLHVYTDDVDGLVRTASAHIEGRIAAADG